MTHPERSTETPDPTASADHRGRTRRRVLWVVLVVSLVCNAVTSALDIPAVVGVGFGLVVLAAGATLAIDHRRRRPR